MTTEPGQRAPSGRDNRFVLFVLLGIAVAIALTIAALVAFLKPRTVIEVGLTPAVPDAITSSVRPNPDGAVLADTVFTGADDFVVDVFHNGQRVPDDARSMTAEVYGAIGERTMLTVREGDWLVFNVANNRLRWDGVYYFGVAGVREDQSIGFVSEESPQWSVCEDPGLAPRFIAEPDFLATNPVQRIEKPWKGGDGLITKKVKGWHGYGIWGSPTNRQIWIKFYAKPAGK